jgi:MFS family permease
MKYRRDGDVRLARRKVFFFPFVYSFSMGMVLVALPLWGLRLEASAVQLGAFGTILAASIVLWCIIFGRLSDRVDRERMMGFGALLASVVICSVPLFPYIQWLFVIPALVGVAGGLYWPALEAKVAEDSDGEGLAGHLSLFNVGWSSGHTAGASLSGFIMGQRPEWAFYLTSSIFLLLSMRILIGHLSRWRPVEVEDPLAREEGEHRPEEADTFLHIARIGSFAVFFGVSSIRWLFPKLALSLGIREGTVGMLIGMVMGAQALMFFLMGRIRLWSYRFEALMMALALPLMGLTLAWVGSSAVVFGMAFCAVGLGAGMTYTMGLFYSVHGHHAKGSNAGMHEAVAGSGSLLGPILGGVAARSYSLRAPGVLSMAVIVMAMVIQCVVWAVIQRRRRRLLWSVVDRV